jgi:transposase-like protein
MRQKANCDAQSSEQIVKGIRRATRKRYSAEDKNRIVRRCLHGGAVRRCSSRRAGRRAVARSSTRS